MGSAGGMGVQPPLAMREPVETVLHGDRRVDHYAWMREKENPRVKEYLEAENVYADAVMRATEGMQEKLYQEMLGRIQQTDLSVPYTLRGYSYYTRTEEGKQYPIYCRRRVAGGEVRLATGPEENANAEMQSTQRSAEENRGLRATGDPRAAMRRSEGYQISDIGHHEEREPSRADSGPDKGEEVLLDLNELAVGQSFMALGIFEVSDDNRCLAYATDRTGYRQYVLEVKDLERRVPLPFRAERVTSAAWAANNRTLFYVTEDEVTKRSNQLWRHELELQRERKQGSQDTRVEILREQKALAQDGSALNVTGEVSDSKPAPSKYEGGAPNPQAKLIYEESDERFRMDVQRSRSGAYLFLEINSHTTSEIRYLRADEPREQFAVIAERRDEHEYYVDHHPESAGAAGGVFFIRTNSGGRTYRLVTAPAGDPGLSNWREVIPNRPEVMLAGLEAFRTHLVLSEREGGLPYLRILDLTAEVPSTWNTSRRIAFGEPTYNAALGTNPEFGTKYVRFMYESLVTPRSVYDYDVTTGEQILKKRQPVLGDFDPARYVSERLHARANDGTLVPISLVRRRDTMLDGHAALLLYGYGSYGFSMPTTFSSNRLSLLDRGMIYAIAHVRGGGELGKPWHDAGRMHQKINTFTDFIVCAEHLIAEKYTTAERLAMEGGSAGGLLMGAVTNLRPELFHVVVSHVPFVDVLNTMLDPSLPLTIGEYEEWGNPQAADDYFYMKQYCPYTNVTRKAYPRMLVKTAWNDSQVMYWEAAKYVAKLRALKSDGNVLLLKTNMGAGHGGASGRYDYLREIALDYAFLIRELGLEQGTRS